jgi:hypothetical protein
VIHPSFKGRSYDFPGDKPRGIDEGEGARDDRQFWICAKSPRLSRRAVMSERPERELAAVARQRGSIQGVRNEAVRATMGVKGEKDAS